MQTSEQLALEDKITEIRENAAPDTVQVLDWWLGLRDAGAAIPRGDSLDLLEFPCSLASTLHVRVEGKHAYRYLYVGNREVALRGYDPTGLSVAENHLGSDQEQVFGKYQSVIDSKIPLFIPNNAVYEKNRLITDMVLFLPFGDEEGVQEILIYCRSI
ncbi:MAG: hypothetical protein AAF220_09790 [Pseudomonadota bacterium]